MPQDFPLSVVVLGNGSVGKSCITIQYLQGHFVDRYDATIEVDTFRKSVDMGGAHETLTIVDTAAPDSIGTMRDLYIKTGQGFVLVYSVADAASFEHVKKTHGMLRRMKGDAVRLVCIIVGNKADLPARERAVTTEEGERFAREAGSTFLEISARDAAHAEDVFTTVLRAVLSERREAARRHRQDVAEAEAAFQAEEAARRSREGAERDAGARHTQPTTTTTATTTSTTPVGPSSATEPPPQQQGLLTTAYIAMDSTPSSPVNGARRSSTDDVGGCPCVAM